MSLLRRGNEVVTVFAEVVTTDVDGNTIVKPSAVGQVAKAVVQPITTDENNEDGFHTSEKLRLRLVGWSGPELGAESQVEWQGRRYSVEGEPKRFRGSVRTAHTDYTLVRK